MAFISKTMLSKKFFNFHLQNDGNSLTLKISLLSRSLFFILIPAMLNTNILSGLSDIVIWTNNVYSDCLFIVTLGNHAINTFKIFQLCDVINVNNRRKKNYEIFEITDNWTNGWVAFEVVRMLKI